jgi:DNA polymerase alpha subunit A
LKKKKYAALKIEGAKTVKECKGLDMVRRDWCSLAKQAGEFVLDLILAGKQRDDMVLILNDYFSTLGSKLKNSQIPLKDFVINK